MIFPSLTGFGCHANIVSISYPVVAREQLGVHLDGVHKPGGVAQVREPVLLVANLHDQDITQTALRLHPKLIGFRIGDNRAEERLQAGVYVDLLRFACASDQLDVDVRVLVAGACILLFPRLDCYMIAVFASCMKKNIIIIILYVINTRLRRDEYLHFESREVAFTSRTA